MTIRTVSFAEHAEFLAFCNAGMRPTGAATRVEDDFPVIFSRKNLEGLYGIRDERGWVAGLAVLTRTFRTSKGDLDVAGIGSVVTRDDRRGQGLSGRLQTVVLGRLAGLGVPLAVLWTDQPEIYAGRGFMAAGWEHHLDLSGAALSDLLHEHAEVRPVESCDIPTIAMLYDRHPLRTRRHPGDEFKLYSMPGTRGIVLVRGRDILAYVFCGKGEDFPAYVTEWGGDALHALAVMAEARRLGLAYRVLVPAGCDDLLSAAYARGAVGQILPSGMWKVLRPELMPGLGECNGFIGMDDPRVWLGHPGSNGRPEPGKLEIAVWGFDSV
jgi:GNAT superfamily N-acetyltransferase